MSQLTNILLAPYNFFFGENGLFATPTGQRRDQSNQALYFGIPALLFAIFGLLFLIVGELSAGKTLIQKYENRVEEITKEESELTRELSQELGIARANNNSSEVDTAAIASLQRKLTDLLDAKKILLSKLHSLSPNQPKYQFQQAGTFFTKSQLQLIAPAESEEKTKIRREIAKGMRDQGISIMKQIAPEGQPGYPEAHLYLAKAALPNKTNVKSAREQTLRLRLANTHVDHALLHEETNTTALRLKVLITQKLGQFDDTKRFLKKLFDTDPFVYPQLCQLNGNLGQADENLTVLHSARERLSSQLGRMTGTSDLRTKHATYLVDCLHRLENIDDADKVVNSETAKTPDNKNVQLWGKRLLAIGQEIRYRLAGRIQTKNAQELIGYLREGHRLDPNNRKLLEHIVNLRSTDIPGLAELSKEIYQPNDKSPASIENILGTQALVNKDYLEATKRFTKATQKSPNNGEYLNNLSYLYISRPDPSPKEALKLIDRAILTAQGSRRSEAYLTHFYHTKGQALLALGKISEENGQKNIASSQYASAIANLLKALIKRPNELKISQAVFEGYKADGQTKQAKVWAERVKQLEAN